MLIMNKLSKPVDVNTETSPGIYESESFTHQVVDVGGTGFNPFNVKSDFNILDANKDLLMQKCANMRRGGKPAFVIVGGHKYINDEKTRSALREKCELYSDTDEFYFTAADSEPLINKVIAMSVRSEMDSAIQIVHRKFAITSEKIKALSSMDEVKVFDLNKEWGDA